MQLSKRLAAVADLVSNGNRLVDVGTDHGYLPIYLIETKKIPSAIALDVNKGPIQRASEHIKEHKLDNLIQTRLSDGVTALAFDEGDSLVIAGMGGGLVIKILTEGKELLKEFKEFILQPQSELEQVRRYLVNSGYRITEENMVLDEGKYYPMMKVVLSNSENSVQVSPNTYYNKDIYFKYGQGLLEGKNEVLKLFLEKEYNTYASILEKLSKHFNENAMVRIKEIEAELLSIKEALKYYECE